MKIRFIVWVAAVVMAGYSCKKNKKDDTSGTNTWDGKYRLEGTLVDAKDPVYVWPGNTYLYNLEVISATQAKLISINLGIAGHMLKNGINETYYSNFGVLVTFDPLTNKVTAVTNTYGQPSPNGRSAVLDPSGINARDPATKNIRIKYWMDEAGFTGHRTSFDETWVYVGPR